MIDPRKKMSATTCHYYKILTMIDPRKKMCATTCRYHNDLSLSKMSATACRCRKIFVTIHRSQKMSTTTCRCYIMFTTIYSCQKIPATTCRYHKIGYLLECSLENILDEMSATFRLLKNVLYYQNVLSIKYEDHSRIILVMKFYL